MKLPVSKDILRKRGLKDPILDHLIIIAWVSKDILRKRGLKAVLDGMR